MKSMLISLCDERVKLQRSHALLEAYNWGQRARGSNSSFNVEWAFFIAQYGIDQEAQQQFVAGYQGTKAP